MRFKLLAIAWTVLTAVALPAQSLRIYCEDDPPMQIRAADGSLSGMTVEMVREIQKRVGNQDPIEMVPWARGYEALGRERNTVLFSMGRTAERDALFQWVGPIAESTFGLYARADSPLMIRTLEDAKRVRAIGVYRDDIRDQFLTRAGLANLDRTNDNVTNFKKLMLGRIDLFASSSNDIKANAEGAGYTLADVKLSHVFLRTQIFIAFSRKTDPAIVARWNAALKAMKKDATFQALFRKYYPDRPFPGPEVSAFQP